MSTETRSLKRKNIYMTSSGVDSLIPYLPKKRRNSKYFSKKLDFVIGISPYSEIIYTSYNQSKDHLDSTVQVSNVNAGSFTTYSINRLFKELNQRISLVFLASFDIEKTHQFVLKFMSNLPSTLHNKINILLLTCVVDQEIGFLSVPIVYDNKKIIVKHYGLLHPLGGGECSLDGIVILDKNSRKKFLFPLQLDNNNQMSFMSKDENFFSVIEILDNLLKE